MCPVISVPTAIDPSVTLVGSVTVVTLAVKSTMTVDASTAVAIASSAIPAKAADGLSILIAPESYLTSAESGIRLMRDRVGGPLFRRLIASPDPSQLHGSRTADS